MKSKWNNTFKSEERKELVSELSEHLKMPELTINILVNRGYKTVDEIENFLRTSPYHSPGKLKDIDEACEAIEEAIDNNENLLIFGDYDADGVTSTTILYDSLLNAIDELGSESEVYYWMNNRFVHGYGINPKGVDDAMKKFPETDLILTCDNGIVAFDGVSHAVSEYDVKVVVTDHHTADKDGKLPDDALAVVNPTRIDDEYPFKQISGATVAFKVMQHFYLRNLLDMDFVNNFIELAALSTVTDVMPLIDENRTILKAGLRIMNQKTMNAGLKAIADINELKVISADNFGFLFGPAINSVGRLESKHRDGLLMTDVVDLLSLNGVKDKSKLAAAIIEKNKERKALTQEQDQIVKSMIEEDGLDSNSVLIVTGKDFHEGIVGLLAGRSKEFYYKPTLVLVEQEDGSYKGSARSIEGFDLKGALDQIKNASPDVLGGYGGHPMAAGMTVNSDNLDEFSETLNDIFDYSVSEEDTIQQIDVEEVLTPEQVNYNIVVNAKMLEPYGQGFLAPNFGLINFRCEDTDISLMGREDPKIHMKIAQKGFDLCYFFLAQQFIEELLQPNHFHAVGTLDFSSFRGKFNITFSALANGIKIPKQERKRLKSIR